MRLSSRWPLGPRYRFRVLPALGCRHRLRALAGAALAVRPKLEPRGQHQQVRRDALSGFRTSLRTSRTFVARCRSNRRGELETQKWRFTGISSDGETRTRTGDTTIFRESSQAMLRRERPANPALCGVGAVVGCLRIGAVSAGFGTLAGLRSPNRIRHVLVSRGRAGMPGRSDPSWPQSAVAARERAIYRTTRASKANCSRSPEHGNSTTSSQPAVR
jgi:hypothetical protein